MITKFRGEKCCLTFISGKSCLLLILVAGFSEKIKSFETKILSAKPIRTGKTRKLFWFHASLWNTDQQTASSWTGAFLFKPEIGIRITERQTGWQQTCARLRAQLAKNPPAVQETRVRSPGQKDPLEKGKAPTPVFLGFPGGSAGEESTCNEGDLGSISGSGRSPGKGKGYLTPVFWPGEFHGL